MKITYSRSQTKNKLDQIHKLKQGTFSGRYRWPKSALQDVLNKHSVWVAYNENTPVGYLLSWRQRNGRCYIGGIAVQTKFRGHGIASKLLALAERHYRRLGFAVVRLDVDVNNPAQMLYFRRGYRVNRVVRSENYMSMHKSLGRQR